MTSLSKVCRPVKLIHPIYAILSELRIFSIVIPNSSIFVVGSRGRGLSDSGSLPLVDFSENAVVAFISILLFAFVGLIIFLVVRSILLGRQLERLADRLSVLERSVSGLTVQRPASASTEQDRPGLTASSESPTPQFPVPETWSPIPDSAIPNTPSPPPSSPSRTREEWEAFVGGRLLNRIGAFAIIIGIGFFLKHAFDNNWISEPVRVLVGAVAGIACLVFARRTHQQGYAVFSQGLVGAGIGILYLSVYATFNFYSLLPQIPSFFLMTAVTVIALEQGVRYRSLAVAILGWAGGYLTPWMLSTGDASEVRLFGYLALLTVGFLGLILRMPEWSVLQPLTAFGTWVWYLVWYGGTYTSDAFGLTLFFVLVFWAAFVAADHAQTRMDIAFGWQRHTTMIMNGLIAALAVGEIVRPESETAAGLVLLALGAAYLLYILRPAATIGRTYIVTVSLTVLIAWCIGTEWIFADYPDVVAWAALAWCAVAVGRRRDWPHLVIAGQVVILLAVLQLLSVDGTLAAENVRNFTPVVGPRTVGFVGLAAGAFLAFLAIPADDPRKAARQMFLLVASATVAALVTVEVNDLLRVWRLDLDPDPIAFRWFLSLLFLGTLWVALGAAAFWAGLRQQLSALLGLGVFLLGLGTMVLALRGLSVPVIDFHQPLLNVRVLTMLAGAGLLVLSARWAAKHPDALRNASAIPQVLAVAAVAIVFSMLTGEARDWFERSVVAARESGPLVLADLRDEQQLAISIVWLLYSVALMAAGFWRSHRGLRLVAMGLFGITILKIFLYDLSSLETGYRIVSFIGLGGILLGVSYGYQRFKHLLI